MISLKNKNVYFKDLGLIDYKSGWDYQETLFNEVVSIKINNRSLPETEHAKTPNYLLACSHPNVYTLGKSGKESNLLISHDILQTIGASYYKINRGGDITFHGPGQIVIYPILDLDNFFTDIHKYLRFLEEAVINTLSEYSIPAGRLEGLTGVWIDPYSTNPRKICAMGVRASRWITMHGLALNTNIDLAYFKNIVACGIENKAVTSMQNELGRSLDIKEVQNKLLQHIVESFEMVLINKI